MIIRRMGLLLFAALLSLQTLAQTEWKSLYYLDHPLVGKVFSTGQQQWLTESQLLAQIKDKQLILLGETHTNLDHHIGQARLIEKWIKLSRLSTSKPAALVFEMLAYDDWQRQSIGEIKLGTLIAELERVSGRWDWQAYLPILKLHLDYQLPILGGNLTRQQLDEFSSQKTCQVSRQHKSVNVCEAIGKSQQQLIKQLIYDAHCDYLPMEHTTPMLQVQLAKDASFALAMAEMNETRRVALIAGTIHVRKDIGVPVHLQELGYKLDESAASIAFINVQEDKFEVQEYFNDSSAAEQFDFVIFTPSERNQDPCVEFSEQLKKLNHSTKTN